MIHKWFASRCVWPNRGATATHRSLNARAAYVKNWELRQRQCTYNYASGKSQCVKTPQSSSSAVCCNQHCAGIVECSCNILELNRIVLSPNGRFWDCAAIAISERHTHVRTDENNTVATQPVYQFDRPQALDNVMLLNVYCTTTVDPFKSLPFPTPNKIKKKKIKSSELLTSLNQYTASACSTQNRPQKQAMAYYGQCAPLNAGRIVALLPPRTWR